MSADPGELIMAENAMMMVHNPWGMVMGYADEMRSYADTLDKVRESYSDDLYMPATGWMKKQFLISWTPKHGLTPNQAIEFGLVDTVSAEKQMAAHVNLSKFGYKNVPKDLPSAVYTVQPGEKFPIRKQYSDMIKRNLV